MVYRCFLFLMCVNVIAAVAKVQAAEPEYYSADAYSVTSSLTSTSGVEFSAEASERCVRRALSAITSYFFNDAVQAYNLKNVSVQGTGNQVVESRRQAVRNRSVERHYLIDAKYSVDVLDDGAVLTWSYKI
ncbi:MAG: hypothetical protein H7A01_02840 [Hahellaceae bacterium]|nr:hypothetical protein [Hahellaceae bacterium]MCP5212421.1 hypothetical protein [Hahellaceae bacterium]